MARSSLLALAITTSALALGCRDATQITVDLSTNVPCEELVGATVSVSDARHTPDTPSPALNTSGAHKCATRAPNNEIGTVVLVPNGDNEAAFKLWAIAGVSGQDPTRCFMGTGEDDHNCIIARRKLAFVPHTELLLPIVLWEACRGNFCNEDQTCIVDENGNPKCVGALIAHPENCKTQGDCGDPILSASSSSGGGGAGGGGAGSGGAGGAGGAASSSSVASSSSASSSSGGGAGGGGGAPAVSEVFANTGDTLVRYDVAQNQLTTVAPFGGCAGINDMAMDSAGNLYGASYTDLYIIDKVTAACSTHIGTGSYPRALSLLPKGQLNQMADLLVGFNDSNYMSFDIATGTQQQLFPGVLGVYLASGDSVLVSGGKSYVSTTNADPCLTSDCLFEVDPLSGAILNKYTLPAGYTHVSGLAFTGGILYGFDWTGQVLRLDLMGNMTVTPTVLTQDATKVFLGAASQVPPP